MVPTTTVNATTSSTSISSGTPIAATILPSSSELSDTGVSAKYSMFADETILTSAEIIQYSDVGMHHVKNHAFPYQGY